MSNFNVFGLVSACLVLVSGIGMLITSIVAKKSEANEAAIKKMRRNSILISVAGLLMVAAVIILNSL